METEQRPPKNIGGIDLEMGDTVMNSTTKCSVCGIELNAINMSDIEKDKCQDCVDEILDKIDTGDESTETANMSDRILDLIIGQANIRSKQRMVKYGEPRRMSV